ncbi:uncharacterized protein LOC111125971 isoform X2 [Crassostrea virginica]|uniref:Uncharacterized protein LOC111125971 n=1 Tax=Crassostrea virginica TaxID=6565 RepID=A0A8B8DD13_CRAVI|nr:uncharacterized protein LOC111125971 [Crassostrea virginica]XP_022325997.1 uncharacterized protein LOC111125971 [Crassostrea virginica]
MAFSLLTVLAVVAFIPVCFQQTITVEGYFGNVRKQTFEIFDTEANVLEAFEFCKVNGMVKANTNPFTFKYVRAKLQEFGWPPDRPIQYPVYDPGDATSQWYDVNRCAVYRRDDGLLTPENANNTCAKLVMDPLSDYLWQPVHCSTRLPFMCNKGHNIQYTGNETYLGTQIDRNATGVGFSVFENRTTPGDCEHHCLFVVRTCIAVEVLQINDSFWECTAAHINFNEFVHLNMSIQISLIPAPNNYTVYVKGLNQSDEVIINNGTSLPRSMNFTEADLGCTFDFNFPTTTIAPNCSCLCNYHNYTDAELQAWIEQLKSELLLNKRALSSSARKKISASDPRASSQAIGSIGALVIVTIVGIIVFPDIPLILKQVKHLTKR